MTRPTDPWNLIALPIFWVLMQVTRLVPSLYESGPVDPPRDSPEIEPTVRRCKDCKADTEHDEFFWRLENETTIECRVCGGIWVTT